MDATAKKNLLEQLREVDVGLSPENLSCDGEASLSQMRRIATVLRRQRRGIIAQLGYEPTDKELYPKLAI